MGSSLIRAFGLLLMLSALALPLSRAPDRDVQTLVARWAPRPSDFMDLDGQLVHLRDQGPRGDPEPLLLLHGSADSLHTWQRWAQALAATRRVVSVDLPGFGLTGPGLNGDYRADAYVPWVLTLADRLGLARFTLVGHDLGGQVAWRVAERAPARVARLVLLAAADDAPAAPTLQDRLFAAPGLNRVAEELLPRGVLTESLQRQWGDPAQVGSALVDRHFELLTRSGNRRALAQRLQARAQEQVYLADAQRRWAALTLPTLLLWGGRDTVQPPERARALARRPGSTLVLFDTLGHVPQEEDPVATLRALQAFLATTR